MRWCSWLRHYAISQKPLAEMSTKNFPGAKGQLVHKADITTTCESIV
jgi:hypothetical protein